MVEFVVANRWLATLKSHRSCINTCALYTLCVLFHVARTNIIVSLRFCDFIRFVRFFFFFASIMFVFLQIFFSVRLINKKKVLHRFIEKSFTANNWSQKTDLHFPLTSLISIVFEFHRWLLFFLIIACT